MPTTKFCALADVKAQLQGTAAYSGDDPQLSAHIETATALIRAYTRRDWETATHVQHFNMQDINLNVNPGRNVAKFYLNERPVASVTSVIFNTGGGFANTTPLEEDISYYLDLAKAQIIFYPGVMTSSLRSLKVTYVAGYPVDGGDATLLLVKESLKRACAIQAALTWKRVINETQGASQKQDRKGFVNFATTSSGLFADALALVKSETRTLVGNG